MQEGTSLVWRNAFYLDSLNINDLTLPNSTWLYSNGDNSNEYLLLDSLKAARAYPRFCNMKRLEVFLLPLGRMPVHHRSLPSNFSGLPNNMSVPILTISVKFNVSETSTTRVYLNQFYCNRIYIQEKLQDSNYLLQMDS